MLDNIIRNRLDIFMYFCIKIVRVLIKCIFWGFKHKLEREKFILTVYHPFKKSNKVNMYFTESLEIIYLLKLSFISKIKLSYFYKRFKIISS